MANLVKFNCVVCNKDDARIIDSDEIIAEKLKALADVSQYVEGENYDDEFSENITKDHVERLLEDRDEAIKAKAMEESQEIIDKANAEAQYIIKKAEKDAESQTIQRYAKAEKEGYEAGFDKGMTQANDMKKQLEQEKADLEKNYQKQIEELEPALVETLLGILDKAFSIEFSEKADFIVHLLQSAFGKIDNSKEYLIRLSREDYEVMQTKKEDLIAELPRSATVEFVEDLTLVKNQCLIETDGGVFDCSLDTQLENLFRDIRMLASTV